MEILDTDLHADTPPLICATPRTVTALHSPLLWCPVATNANYDHSRPGSKGTTVASSGSVHVSCTSPTSAATPQIVDTVVKGRRDAHLRFLSLTKAWKRAAWTATCLPSPAGLKRFPKEADASSSAHFVADKTAFLVLRRLHHQDANGRSD